MTLFSVDSTGAGSSTVSQDYNKKAQLYSEQVGLVYEQALPTLLGTAASAVVLSIVLWKAVGHSLILGWLIALLAVTGFRYLLVRSYFRSSPGVKAAPKWGLYFLIIILFSGLVWGSSGIILFPKESIHHQVFLVFILAGISAGSLTSYSAMKWNVLAFVLPALLPVAANFLISGDDEISITMGIMILVFLALIYATSSRMHKTTKKSLNLRLVKTDLIAHLEEEKIWVEQLNEELRQEIAERKQVEEEREKVITELQEALEKIKTLRGLVPICASCKKVRDDKGYWKQVEIFIQEHSEAEFSHSICPDCMKKLYPDLEKSAKKNE